MNLPEYLIIYFHETGRFTFQDVKSDLLYIGGEPQLSISSNLTDNWLRYLTSKGISTKKAQLLVLPLSERSITPLLTLKKQSGKWLAQPGIPNHYLGNHTIRIDGNLIKHYNEYNSIQNNSVICITNKNNTKSVTILLSPSFFHIDLLEDINRFDFNFSAGRFRRVLFSYSHAIPYASNQVQAITGAFEHIELSAVRESQRKRLPEKMPALSPKYIEELKLLGYWQYERLISDLHEEIGHVLYNTLFCDRIHQLVNIFIENRLRLEIILYFPKIDKLALLYPWELLYNDGTFLTLTGQVMLKRVIAINKLQPSKINKANVLFVNPDPYNNLPDKKLPDKKEIIKNILNNLQEKLIVTVNKKPIKNWTSFKDEMLYSPNIDIVHFDGHTRFGKKCICSEINKPNSDTCIACGYKLMSKVSSYFEFEHDDGKPDFVDIDDVKNLILSRLNKYPLDNFQIRLMIFTSCDSAKIRDYNFQKTIAPVLIKAGVSNVIAMQGKVLTSAMETFVKHFYNGILSGHSLLESINQSRIEMKRDDFMLAWFVPVVYSNTSDDSCIFIPNPKEK